MSFERYSTRVLDRLESHYEWLIETSFFNSVSSYATHAASRLPTNLSDLDQSPPASRNTKWVEGLRGVAAIMVITSHLVLGYCERLDTARFANEPFHWFNAPFLRVMYEGAPWVLIFLILTGFVNSLKPIKQARSGNTEAAIQALASSTFKRLLRLMLPCMVATIMIWPLAEFGGFVKGAMIMSPWMVRTSPLPSGGIWKAFVNLLKCIVDTWSWNQNDLDMNQWAMIFFLKGSMALYLFLLATVKLRSRFRISIAVGLVWYGGWILDPWVFMPIFTGAIIAEVSMTKLVPAFIGGNRKLRFIPYAVFLLGWYFISYPLRFPERMPWSNGLKQLGLRIFPSGSDLHPFYAHLGGTFIIVAVLFSPTLQWFFNTKPIQWLGARSFPIYLIHGPLLRSLLNWMLLWGVDPVPVETRDDKGRVLRVDPMYLIPPLWKFFWAVPIFLVVTLYLSNLWLKYVEPQCGKAANWIETQCIKVHTKVTQAHELSKEREPVSSGSPLSRATTPMNEVESILPR